MTEPQGKYLLIIKRTAYETDIMRYKTTKDLIEAVKDGVTFGAGFIVAQELELSIVTDRYGE